METGNRQEMERPAKACILFPVQRRECCHRSSRSSGNAAGTGRANKEEHRSQPADSVFKMADPWQKPMFVQVG